MENKLYAVPAAPPKVDEWAELKRSSLESSLVNIPPRELDRLRAQLTPMLRRAPVFPDDRDAMTRLLREWELRGLPVYAFNAVHDLLWEDHRAERQAATAPVRRYYEQAFAPWFAPELDEGEPNAGRHRALELVHGRRRFPFPAGTA